MNKKIQIIRALAICAVIMIHSNAGGIIGVCIRPFINFAVAMFLFCSGYLTNVENDSWSNFYKKRLMKVVIPYIIWSIIYTVAKGDYSEIMKNLFTTKGSYHFYYIFVYIQLVLLTPLIAKMLKSGNRLVNFVGGGV